MSTPGPPRPRCQLARELGVFVGDECGWHGRGPAVWRHFDRENAAIMQYVLGAFIACNINALIVCIRYKNLAPAWSSNISDERI